MAEHGKELQTLRDRATENRGEITHMRDQLEVVDEKLDKVLESTSGKAIMQVVMLILQLALAAGGVWAMVHPR